MNPNIDGLSDVGSEIVDLGGGFIIKYEVTELNPNARASTKTATKTATCVYEGKTIAVVKITGSFSYTGSNSTCTSVSATYTTYDGWSVSNKSTYRSGNTGTTTAKISKGKEYINFVLSIKCSTTGVIS